MDEHIHGIGHAANQQVLFEHVHHLGMHRFVKSHFAEIPVPDSLNGEFVEAVRPKELLEIQRIHMFRLNAANWNRRCLCQGDTQKRATSNIRKAVALFQELEQGQQVRIFLDFVKKDQRVLGVPHLVACKHAQAQVEIVNILDIGK